MNFVWMNFVCVDEHMNFVRIVCGRQYADSMRIWIKFVWMTFVWMKFV